MNAIFLVGFVALAMFCLCEGATPSISVQGQDLRALRNVAAGQAIKIFDSPSSSNGSHSIGGMKFSDGQIVIPDTGVYFIFATLRLHAHKQRFALTVNSQDVFYGIPVGSGATSISGTYCLRKGDKLGLKAYDKVVIWVQKTHDNFGAYQIIGTEACDGNDQQKLA